MILELGITTMIGTSAHHLPTAVAGQYQERNRYSKGDLPAEENNKGELRICLLSIGLRRITYLLQQRQIRDKYIKDSELRE